MTKIKTVEDLKKALLRLDEIFDIPVDDPRRDERAALIDAVEKYEDEHCHIQPPTEEEERAFRREQESLIEDAGLPFPVEVPPMPLVSPPRCNQELNFFDKSPDNLKAVGDSIMGMIEEAFRYDRECFINKIKDSFEEIDKFAEENQKEIFVLNGYKNCLGINAIYVGALVDEIQIRLIYKESYWGESEKFEFEIPLEYMGDLEGWLEELRKEK
jgi:hypothetical protein